MCIRDRYRSNAQSRILEDAILNSELPYRIYGGVRFYERMEIKNALAYAKLAINKNNDSQFERVINTPTRGIGVKTMDQIREHAKKIIYLCGKHPSKSSRIKKLKLLKIFLISLK